MLPQLFQHSPVPQVQIREVDDDHLVDRLAAAHAGGRQTLYENECYEIQAAIGAEAAPASRLIPIDGHPTAADLEHLRSDLVVLKVVSPDITHKTEAKGVRIVAREIGAVEAAFDRMANRINNDLAGADVVVICVMNGGRPGVRVRCSCQSYACPSMKKPSPAASITSVRLPCGRTSRPPVYVSKSVRGPVRVLCRATRPVAASRA